MRRAGRRSCGRWGDCCACDRARRELHARAPTGTQQAFFATCRTAQRQNQGGSCTSRPVGSADAIDVRGLRRHCRTGLDHRQVTQWLRDDLRSPDSSHDVSSGVVSSASKGEPAAQSGRRRDTSRKRGSNAVRIGITFAGACKLSKGLMFPEHL